MLTKYQSWQRLVIWVWAGLMASLVGCGGGGSGEGGFGNARPDNVPRLELTVELLDADSETVVTSISPTQPSEVRVRVRDLNARAPLTNAVVEVTTTLGALEPQSGSVLTNAQGIASIILSAAGGTGAGTITATSTQGGQSFSGSANFEVRPTALRIGNLVDGVFRSVVLSGLDADAVLAPAGATSLRVTVLDEGGEPVIEPTSVTFSSDCQLSGQAEITSPVLTRNGIAETTYLASGCAGTDRVVAALEAFPSVRATGSVVVAAASANSIAYVSAVPLNIALRGTGGAGRTESAVVSFRVDDETGQPKPNVPVRFSLSTTTGGLSLSLGGGAAGSQTLQRSTNAQGVAAVTVNAGNVATTVRVIAEVDSTTSDGQAIQLQTVSDQLVVSTGLPDQNSVSLAAEAFNLLARDIDGVTTTLTLSLADKFNNPVPDGTVANFTTEYGSIEPSCATDGGVCSVTWRSQEPRRPLSPQLRELIRTTRSTPYSCPEHRGNFGPCPSSLGEVRGFRSTVTVTAIGEESFIDENGNGRYDIGEPFEDLSEAWTDHNEDNQYRRFDSAPLFFPNGGPGCQIRTPNPEANQACPSGNPLTPAQRLCLAGSEETFVDFDSDGRYSLSNQCYNGTLCSDEALAANRCTRNLVNVRADTVITLSGEDQEYLLVDNRDGRVRGSNLTQAFTINVNNADSFTVMIADRFNNAPPTGSTISVESTDCEVITPTSFTVQNQSLQGAFTLPLRFQEDRTNEQVTEGSVTIRGTGPGGEDLGQLVFQCVDPADDPCGFSPLPPSCVGG